MESASAYVWQVRLLPSPYLRPSGRATEHPTTQEVAYE